MSQKDEPDQKNCIYQVRSTPRLFALEEVQTKYSQIRVKSINYLDSSAVAVYFYDFTQHIKSQQLLTKYLDQRLKNKNLRDD